MRLIIFSGLPGTGKSSIAETVGRRQGVPVFAKDHLEATLLRSGIYPKQEDSNLGYAGYELLSLLAERQLFLGQSAILDSVASFERIRAQWRQLAAAYGAEWHVIECVCSNTMLQKQRIRTRKRNIRGWHELHWEDVKKVRAYYEPWQEQRLVLDAVDLLEANVSKAMAYLENHHIRDSGS
ncbi:MAG: AAA family ATPase [Candidatus Promineifilaceae bacterium]|nr:AAA family ATPase [Candidatus Promineifilaceae bacterium]